MPASSTSGISVVIPFYNGHDVIANAILSVDRQTLKAQEIIIVDDGSISPLEISELPEIETPIRIVREANSGQSKARNIGVQHSACATVAFLDQDDVFMPNHLATLGDLLKKNLGFVFSDFDLQSKRGFIIHNYRSRVARQSMPTNIHVAMQRNLYILPTALLIDKKAFLEIGGFDQALRGFEDDDLILRFLKHGFQGASTPVSTVIWKHSHSSSSRSDLMAMSRGAFVAKWVASALENKQSLRHLLGRFLAPELLGLIAFRSSLARSTKLVQMAREIHCAANIKPWALFKQALWGLWPTVADVLSMEARVLVRRRRNT